jgi:hypothetical protein
VIESMAKKAGRPIAWNFKHLDHKLSGVNGPQHGICSWFKRVVAHPEVETRTLLGIYYRPCGMLRPGLLRG